jgi:hypothetical protein
MSISSRPRSLVSTATVLPSGRRATCKVESGSLDEVRRILSVKTEDGRAPMQSRIDDIGARPHQATAAVPEHRQVLS